MPLIDEIKTLASSSNGVLAEKKGLHTLTIVVAERKAFLSRKKLEYIARFRLDEAARELKFTEMLKETGSGLSAGGGDDFSSGFGFSAGVYKTGPGGNSGSIEEQSVLFGKKFEYKFDFKALRARFEALASAAGFAFKYQITAAGL